jgi:glycerophosphoryl diester phosphodiesterase
MHAFLEGSEFTAFAHRGGALETAENTMDAFEHAVGLGYRYIETDVQLSADGIVVVFHDDRLDRLTDLEGRIADHPWEVLSRTKVHGTGFIPRLSDVLAAWPQVHFNIDAKTDDVAAPLCSIARLDNLDRFCLASDNDRRIAYIRSELGPRVCTAAASREAARFLLPPLLGLPPGHCDADCLQIPPRSMGLPLLTARQLNCAAEAGKAVHIWTIDDEREMEGLVDLGGGGIMTDRPWRLREVLKRRNLWVSDPDSN